MLRLAGTLILLLLMLFSATVYLLDIDPRNLQPSKPAESTSKQEDAKATAESPKGEGGGRSHGGCPRSGQARRCRRTGIRHRPHRPQWHIGVRGARRAQIFR